MNGLFFIYKNSKTKFFRFVNLFKGPPESGSVTLLQIIWESLNCADTVVLRNCLPGNFPRKQTSLENVVMGNCLAGKLTTWENLKNYL